MAILGGIRVRVFNWNVKSQVPRKDYFDAKGT